MIILGIRFRKLEYLIEKLVISENSINQNKQIQQ